MEFHLIRIIYHIHMIHRLVVKTFKSINQDYRKTRSREVKRVGVLEILVNTSAAKNGQGVIGDLSICGKGNKVKTQRDCFLAKHP